MFIETIRDFLKEVGFALKKIITSRVIPFVLIMVTLFGVLIYRLFDLQIVNGEFYKNSYNLKTEKTVTINGYRGNVYDCEGRLLAYSELAYSVVIEDCGFYESTKVKHEILNGIINDTVNIIESNGDKLDYDFPIKYENNKFVFTISDNALLRFLRDIYGHSNISQLTEEERNATATQVVKHLMERYKINQSVETKQYDNQMVLKIIYIRYTLAQSSYKRYISYTLASNVSKETMASILENSDKLIGVTIEEEYIRKYNYGTYIAHIIGYTGKVSSSELEELQKIDPSYEATDIVGKAGIEAEFETILAGKKGYEKILVDNVGRVMEVIETVDATIGNDVYLTIDAEYQKELYNLMEKRLADVLLGRMVSSEETRVNNQIVIPINDVIIAMINNNLIDTEELKNSTTDAGTTTYKAYISKKTSLLKQIESELGKSTPYNKLSDEMKTSISRVRRLLIDTEIINADNISSDDPVQKSWLEGNISLSQYLREAINKDWINIYNLDLSTEYPTKEEVLSAIYKEAISLITNDNTFDKSIYSSLIKNKQLAPRNICLILMEQNGITYTESEYQSIKNGGSVYEFVKSKIKSLELTPAMLALDPCSGSCIVEDPNTGRLLAMVTYPSYDINKFSGTIDADYYAQLLSDASTPLVNRSTQTKVAPGSTFKPLIALAGINEKLITEYTQAECDGIFDMITPNIKCHIYPGMHESVSLKQAMAVSCNEYFCGIGYKLCLENNGRLNFNKGLNTISKYAEILGLSTKTGIQIPETNPQVTDYNPVASAIGQGTNAYTALNLARYATTLANSGTVYNSSIVLKSIDNSSGEINIIEPSIERENTIPQATWVAVRDSMREVILSSYAPVASNVPATLYGKSGTAEENKNRANHANFICFAYNKDNKPELVVSCVIPYGYVAANAAIMAHFALCEYYDIEPTCLNYTLNNQWIMAE